MPEKKRSRRKDSARGAASERTAPGRPAKAARQSGDSRKDAVEQQSSRLTEQRFIQITASTSEHLVEIDNSGLILFVNKPFAGVTRDRVLGTSLISWLPEGLHDQALELVAQVFATGETRSVQYTMATPRGEQTYKATISPLKENDRTATAICTLSNITESRRLEADLRESEERFRASVETMFDSFGIYKAVRDAEGRITDFQIEYVNAAACASNNMTRDEQIGKGLLELLPSHRDSGLFDEYCRLVETGETLVKESLTYSDHYAGRQMSRPFDIRAARLKDGFVATWRDITERQDISEALRVSEERYRRIVEASNEGIWILDTSGRTEYVNSRMADMLGYTTQEMQGRHLLDFLPADVRQAAEGQLEGLRRGVTETLDFRLCRKDGTELWAIVSATPIITGGRYVGALGMISDITERKRAEEKLTHMHDLMRYVISHAQSAIAVHDKNMNYIYVSDQYLKQYKVKENDVIGKHHYEVFPDLPQKWREVHQRVLAGAVEGKDEDPYVRQDGSVDWTRWSCRPWYERDGSIGGLIVYTEVITDRVRREEALRESESLLRKIAENYPNSYISIIEGDLRVGFTSGQEFKKSNLNPEHFIGMTLEQVFGAQAPVVRGYYLKTFQGQEQAFELFINNQHQFYRTVPLQAPDGSIPRILSVVENITERKRSEEALREREKQLAESQRVAHIGSWEWDALQDTIWWSDEYYRIYNIDPRQPTPNYEEHKKVYTPQSAAALDAAVRRAMETGEPYEIDLELAQPSQRTQWVMARGEAKRDAEGKIWGLRGTAQDITERKRAEQALKDSEARLRAAQRLAQIGDWDYDPSGDLLTWSEELYRTFEIRKEDGPITIKRFLERVHPEDRQKVTKQMRSGLPYRSDYRIVLPDGAVRNIHEEVELNQDANGKIVHIAGTAQDITVRVQAEEKIRQNEAFIRNILDTVDEGFIVLDRDYRILTVNRAYCDQVGRQSDQIIGGRCHEISDPANRPCHEENTECSARQAFLTGCPSVVLHKHADSDGQILYVETKAYPLRDASGTITSVIETISNITERHLLEEERLKTQKLESIGMLAGGIAHDFNNLLHGLFGYISMAQVAIEQKDKALAMLEQAEKALQQSVDLTNQLLTFSKGGKPVRKTLSIRAVMENAVRFALSGSRCEYHIECDPDLWRVDADEGQLGQVIQNIVLNADQAMPLGGCVEILARNLSTADASLPRGTGGTDHVLITIRDSGVGIPEQYLSKIFDPYFTTKEKGSGLGLATSYSIIKNHGGFLDVRSEVGIGTSVLIYLPASPTRTEEPKEAEIVPETRSCRVLVMDDERTIRMVVGELLRALGHEVEFADRGESALGAYRAAMEAGKPFDIVILDLTIRGGMGGQETIGRLLQMDPEVKAVVSSGYSENEGLSRYQELGFKAFLKKPYRMNELQSVLSGLLSSTPADPEIGAD